MTSSAIDSFSQFNHLLLLVLSSAVLFILSLNSYYSSAVYRFVLSCLQLINSFISFFPLPFCLSTTKMRFSAAFTLAFATLSVAAPTTRRSLKTRGVLGTATYDELSISGGVAGDGEAEALAKLPIDVNDLANVDAADLAFLGDVNDIANDAEVSVFNPAIEAATGEEKTALEVCGPILPPLLDT